MANPPSKQSLSKLAKRLERLAKYTGHHTVSKKGDVITLTLFQHAESLRFNTKTKEASLYTWEISMHNGDHYGRKDRALSPEETATIMVDYEDRMMRDAHQRAKAEVLGKMASDHISKLLGEKRSTTKRRQRKTP